MNAEDFDLGAILRMAHSPLLNYVLPGLTSSLIGAPSPAGTVRLFQNSRDQQENITPHSHRFDFLCWVLRGMVTNRLWRVTDDRERGDLFTASVLSYDGSPGKYTRDLADPPLRWAHFSRVYREGQCYSMRSHEIHSINFSRDAIVLFFEGPTVSETTQILEPYVDGEVIPTLEVKSWMFKRAGGQP